MKFYSSEIVEKVREERRKGLSLRKLEELFHISNTTISLWVRDIESKHPASMFARKREKEWRDKLKNIGSDYKINQINAQILVSLLYWCEGSKYPTTNNVSFANSDFALVKTYLALLRIGFHIDEKKFRVRLQIHTTHNYQELLNFWSKLLTIPENQFEKPTITNPTKNMKRQNYRGTCTIKYYDVKLQLSIMGLYEAFASRF
jgi:transcriptional regulator with XRE-family HTH domain